MLTAPVDLDVVVRKASAEEAARKNPYFDGTMVPPPQLNGPPPVPFDEDAPLRFKVNDLVMAFMGPSKGYIRAMIVGEKPKLKQPDESILVKAYALQLEQTNLGQPGPVVYAPRDDDASVRKPTTAEAKAPPLLASVVLRFKVGESVLANLGAPHGYVKGKVLRIKPQVQQGGPDAPRRPNMPMITAAYEIELREPPGGGTVPAGAKPPTVFAPADVDNFVKADEDGGGRAEAVATASASSSAAGEGKKAKGKKK